MTSPRSRALGAPQDELVLDGAWRAAIADGDLAREFASRDFDDRDWSEVTVPGHWGTHAELADATGSVLHRRRFDTAPLAVGRRRFLTLDGVFTQGDVWLDGDYLGTTEGYFTPHTFEITGHTDTEHLLAVEVACPGEADRRAKRGVTGVFSHWDAMDPAARPGGI